MLNIKIGGVPEHFNYPWHLTLKNKEHEKNNIAVSWQDFPGGTGAMCKALRNKEIDIAIVLTEGIIKDIINGNPSKITQTYVKSPLVWGIHVSTNSKFKTIADLEYATIAISRFGSGSHLMAIVNAYNNGWDLDKLKFKVIGNLDGGIEALTNGEADYFMWEHFTTKPLVDNGTFRRLGDCPTPWPCFVVAVRDEILEKNPEAIKTVLDTINSYTKGFKTLKNISGILAKEYDQQETDIKEWLSITEWNEGKPIDEQMIADIQHKMIGFNVIEKELSPEKLIRNLYL